MISWPTSLVEDIARRRAILFLGAGVSRNSLCRHGNKRPPMWDEFLKNAIATCPAPTRHISTLINRNNYLTACEILKCKMDDEWLRYVHQEFVTPGFAPATIHELIFKLDLRIVLTQNVDKIYDTYAQNESNGTVLTKLYYDDDVAHFVRGDKQCIIKAHGTVDSPENMIFTRNDYAKARYKHAGFYALMDGLAATNTFLFLGCGLNDPDVQIMLEKYNQLFALGRPHYMVSSKQAVHQDIRDSARRNMNLKTLAYNPKDFHKELGDSLESLVCLVESQRTEFAGNISW